MPKILKQWMRRTLLASQENLTALDDPYNVLARLLKKHVVTGILDAGASNGRVARKLLRLFPKAKAYAFEANPAYAEVLNQYAAEDSRVLPQMSALADAPGIIELNVAQSPGVTSLFRPAARLRQIHPMETEIRRVERVPAVRLDDWVEQNRVPAIELMKFDIQGAELLAMKGAEKTLRETTLVVYTEVFFNPMYEGGAVFAEIDLFLRTCGFLLYNLYKVRADARGMLNQANAVYVKADALETP